MLNWGIIESPQFLERLIQDIVLTFFNIEMEATT